MPPADRTQAKRPAFPFRQRPHFSAGLSQLKVGSLLILGLCLIAGRSTLAAPLSESDILALFFERNLNLIAQHYRIDSAEAQTLIASALPNPELTIGFNELSTNIRHFSPNSNGDNQAVGMNIIVTQLIQTNGKRALRMESSETERAAVETDFQDLIRLLINTVRSAYYRLLFNQKNLEFQTKLDENYQRLVNASKIRLAAGDISETELIRVEVEELKIRAEVDRATAQLKASQSELANLLSWPEASSALEVLESWPEIPPGLLKPDLDRLISEAYQSRPDYRAQELRTEQMQTELELARRRVVPDVTVSGGFLQDSGNVRPYTGVFNISAPIPAWYQYQGEIGKAAADLNSARLGLEQIRNSIRGEVISAHAALLAARAIVSRYEKETRERIERVKESAEYAYSQGAIGLIDLLDSERNYRQMVTDYYGARSREAIAYADLVKALGEDVTRGTVEEALESRQQALRTSPEGSRHSP